MTSVGNKQTRWGFDLHHVIVTITVIISFPSIIPATTTCTTHSCIIIITIIITHGGGRGRKRHSDDTEDDSFPPQRRRVRLRVISSLPSPSSSPVRHHHSSPSHPPSSSPPRASSPVAGLGQRTTATQTDQGRRRRTVPRTNHGRQTRTASRTDQLIARQTTLGPYLRPFPPQMELWQEPLQPGWGRNGTASKAVRTGVQNAAAAPLAMGPHRRCQNCHCELSSAPGPSLLCDLCGRYADRMVSLSQCYLFRLFNHA